MKKGQPFAGFIAISSENENSKGADEKGRKEGQIRGMEEGQPKGQQCRGAEKR